MFVDFQLEELCHAYSLVTPYDPAKVNPASIDLTLGRDFVNCGKSLVTYQRGRADFWQNNYKVAEPGERFIAELVYLQPRDFVLSATAETVKIPDSRFYLSSSDSAHLACAALLCLKSSAARHALNHSLAGWIDPGFEGQLTLELHCLAPVTLYAGQAYCQMIVHALLATPRKSYRETGRYTGEFAQGAVLARE